ncbi:MAG: tetratricopeptide repeat protein [Anaerolineaceae bacterium]
MTTSLEQGIEAAKSGQMEQALAHLKDAIVEEPTNADVWVWLAAIIEDETKQTIFLKKALELDPSNRPAQRGLAFIERKKYIPPKPGEKLSDYTRPIGIFKAAPAQIQVEQEPEPTPAPEPQIVLPTPAAEETPAPAPAAEEPPKKQSTRAQKPLKTKVWLDVLMYGVTLMVFIVIGILIGTTLLNVNIPFLTEPTPVLTVLPENEGVFLLENGQFTEMALNLNVPKEDTGIPVTKQTLPELVVNNQVISLERLQLLDEAGLPVAFTTRPVKDNIHLLIPQEALAPGRYCIVFTLNVDRNEALYWCLRVE